MGILKDKPVLLRVIHTFLVFVGLHMSAEIHSMTCVFWLFKYTRDCFRTPAIEISILVTVIPALRQCISRRRGDTFFCQNASDLRRTVVFLLPRNDQKLLYLTVTKLLVIMTKTNEKEKEIITAQSFDEHKLVITSFVAKSHGYYNKLRAVCQSQRKNYLS